MEHLRSEPIDIESVIDSVAHPDHGGLGTFIGTTRAEPDPPALEALHYEAHHEMAEAELGEIEREAQARFGARCAVVHRTGRVAVGEASVAVAASAPHRPAAFAACRYLIDETKDRAPIWKRSEYAGGDGVWHDGLVRRAR